MWTSGGCTSGSGGSRGAPRKIHPGFRGAGVTRGEPAPRLPPIVQPPALDESHIAAKGGHGGRQVDRLARGRPAHPVPHRGRSPRCPRTDRHLIGGSHPASHSPQQQHRRSGVRSTAVPLVSSTSAKRERAADGIGGPCCRGPWRSRLCRGRRWPWWDNPRYPAATTVAAVRQRPHRTILYGLRWFALAICRRGNHPPDRLP